MGGCSRLGSERMKDGVDGYRGSSARLQRGEMENSKELMYEADQSSKLRPFDVHFPVNTRQ